MLVRKCRFCGKEEPSQKGDCFRYYSRRSDGSIEWAIPCKKCGGIMELITKEDTK